VTRTTRIFFATLICSTAMLGTARAIRPGIDGASVMLEMIRFVLISGGAAAALAAWGTAVFAAVHHVTWPLVVALLALLGSTLAFAVI
jgi:hypothetical protein